MHILCVDIALERIILLQITVEMYRPDIEQHQIPPQSTFTLPILIQSTKMTTRGRTERFTVKSTQLGENLKRGEGTMVMRRVPRLFPLEWSYLEKWGN